MSTITQPRLGPLGTARWFWRQLTSMRTALFLLLLLAVAAIPGSIIPQTGIDAGRVATYKTNHPSLAPWLDRLGFFNVFTSPWFAAIYILLIISLIGCVIPRIRIHLRTLRAPVPRTPKNLSRLPAYVERSVDEPADVVLDRAREVLKRKRYRVREDETVEGSAQSSWSIAAEAGRMRETGNLIFHSCLIWVVLAVAAGHLWGWRADVIVPVGQGFSNSGGYDTENLGPLVDDSKFSPWSIRLNSLDVSFEDKVPPTSPQYGQPRHFTAYTTVTGTNGKSKREVISVNHSLPIGGSSVYLLGNGYAPMITVRDAKGNVLYRQETPFLSQDNNYKSTGAIKVSSLPAAKQMGFFGFFLPTAAFSDTLGPVSTFPAPKDPALVLGMYVGNLFPGNAPQSVYTLDTSAMKQVQGTGAQAKQPLRIVLKPGQTTKLPGGRGSITFDNVQRWAGLSTRHDPGKMPALYGALLGLIGLIMSMTLRRRRVFVKVSADPQDPARSLVRVGGLAKGEDPRLQVAIDGLALAVAGDDSTHVQLRTQAGART
ncbi:cytochrome c biogenesis protein ResB [Allobranchiibius huperziae]|uniref:Cytochrome c biogenesis protein n=1 Tax=Allobranchiibius huperziae TaxID=1874116 RepID=A0A853D7Z3_9MICO|nr:cytochrome c biogenesis protein ResB [Allobranchiibius huperziae]NYJ73526.1 cytochrome c biogenesis protein [Allobranchiibius huperziae]